MNCFEFAEEWKKTEKYLRSFIGGVIFSANERDDLLQNVALAMWKKIDSFDPSIASFKTWAAGMARFECLNYMNRCKSSKVLFDDELLNNAAAEIHADETQECAYEDLSECMLELGTEKVEILKMKYDEHLSIVEISRKLNTSEAAVKEKLYRARKELRSIIINRKKSSE